MEKHEKIKISPPFATTKRPPSLATIEEKQIKKLSFGDSKATPKPHALKSKSKFVVDRNKPVEKETFLGQTKGNTLSAATGSLL